MKACKSGATRVAPVPSATNTVVVRGEELHTVLWAGSQWAVTEYGIECRDGTYAIAKIRLREDEAAGLKYGWVKHMREKAWVDLADFELAFDVACFIHLGEPWRLAKDRVDA